MCGKVVVCGTVMGTVSGKVGLRSGNVEGLHCGPDRRGAERPRGVRRLVYEPAM